MAEATALKTSSPKQLGKHIREVRRRKGLSRSEVARGAGLTRRELSAYEKGRSPIPDSDLFVLAGSCGVDVAELRVPTSAADSGAARQADDAPVPSNGAHVSSSIEVTVAPLRRGQEVAAPSVSERWGRAHPRALGSTDVVATEPAPTDSPDSSPAVAPAAAPSPSASDARAPAEPVDIFEELAQLPEPEPLSADASGDHDIFSPPPGDAQALAEWPAFESKGGEDAATESLSEPSEPAETGPDVGDDQLPAISWRPQANGSLTPTVETFVRTLAEPREPVAPVAPVAQSEPAAEPGTAPEPEQFVTAGSEWVLGNAVPLVEVGDTGGLVMRRADERWALADVVAASNFALEVDVDLRSGPGFGVLFCADVDERGRMSGYSFDVDPVYEGGGYLVREWCADREQWNPIAHVSAATAAHMHGLLEVRVTLDDGRLVASVNGETVLTVENLPHASIDRGRAGASGHRVGVQAWSSTDLVIDELRLANR